MTEPTITIGYITPVHDDRSAELVEREAEFWSVLTPVLEEMREQYDR